MSTLQEFGRSLRDTWDDLSEGWEQLWHKTRNALTRFSAEGEDHGAEVPVQVRGNRWGLLAADVEESDDKVLVRLETPGLEASDLNIEVVGQRLIVTGEKRYSNTSFQGRVYMMEAAYGRFRREIPLPANVDHRDSGARYQHGVLTVELSKSPENKPVRISVAP